MQRVGAPGGGGGPGREPSRLWGPMPAPKEFGNANAVGWSVCARSVVCLSVVRRGTIPIPAARSGQLVLQVD